MGLLGNCPAPQVRHLTHRPARLFPQVRCLLVEQSRGGDEASLLRRLGAGVGGKLNNLAARAQERAEELRARLAAAAPPGVMSTGSGIDRALGAGGSGVQAPSTGSGAWETPLLVRVQSLRSRFSRGM